MKQINYKKLILPNIPYVFFVYLFDKVGQAVRLAPGADISAKILNITQGFSAAFENALPSVYPLDLLVGIVGAVIIRLIVYVKGKNAKKYRKGAEYGSARWGNAEDIKPYIDPEFQNNIILTQTERLTMNSRPKQPKYARNKNVVVIGGSGSGKTRFFVKPNLMQLHSSYVLTDPKGTVLIECGKLLQRAGYRIKVLNTINFKKSMHYNPFVYIRSEKDILKLVNTLIANTKGEGEKSAEDFWVKAERLLYCALVGYIWYEAPAEEMNFITLLELINASEAREDDEEYQSPVDLLFADLEERDPDHFAVKQYRKYKLAAGIAYDKVVLFPASHAAYYPGARSMAMKVLYEKESLRLLGAQIVGGDGVDKRIDVLATAIRAGITALELTELDLAYAPPYSSAKDPVNMAGFMIEDLESGKVRQFHWNDVEDLPCDGSATLLDVRTEGEYRRGHLNGFRNIPLDDLREHLDELERDKPIYVNCQTGLRSYLACRLLTQYGFSCSHLSGGYSFYQVVTQEQQTARSAYPCGKEKL